MNKRHILTKNTKLSIIIIYRTSI